MTTATQNKCRSLRNEVIALGFTRQQFDAMAKAAYRWPDNYGSWHSTALCVRNQCVYWGSPEAMKASDCYLGRQL
jgi:hypothetical protein